jgi:hypothetical protein
LPKHLSRTVGRSGRDALASGRQMSMTDGF